MIDLVERLRKRIGDPEAWLAAAEIERLREVEAILSELLEGLREGEGLKERYERRYALLDRGRRLVRGT